MEAAMELPFSIALLKAYNAQANAIRPHLPELGLSAGQPKILNFLIRNDGCSQKDLAALCDIEPATVSRLLDKMEADGLILRTPSPRCKRRVSICLTDLGWERQQAFLAVREAVEERELAGFTPEERAAFYSYLTRLYANLTTKEEGPSR